MVACVRAIHRHPNAVVREVRAAYPGMDEDSVLSLAFDEIAESCAVQAIIDAAEYDEAERIRNR